MISWRCKHCNTQLFGQSVVMAEHLATCAEYLHKRLGAPREHHTVIPTKFKVGDRVCNHDTRECVKGVVVGFEVRYIVKQDSSSGFVPNYGRRGEKLKLEPVDPLVEAQKEITRLRARVFDLETAKHAAERYGGLI